MCLIFISLDQHPSYKLIVAGNRDEFYNRPTQPAAYWPDADSVLAGRVQIPTFINLTVTVYATTASIYWQEQQTSYSTIQIIRAP